jgi:hypothetical protein
MAGSSSWRSARTPCAAPTCGYGPRGGRGTVDSAEHRIAFDAEPTPANEDLLDRVATQTILRGAIYTVKPAAVPDGQVAAAIFRY